MRTYRAISCDGHLEIPPDPWIRHVPAEHRDRAPRLVKLRTGGEGWVVEGSPLIHNGQNVAAGRPLKVKGGSYWEDDGVTPVPGTGDAAQRLREQDLDGVDAEVLYPPVFISRFIENIEDREAYVAMVRAYNDFLAEDYCSVAPDRLIGNAVIPASGIEDAIAELKRAKSIGLRSVTMASFPNGTGRPAPEDDAFWEAALELGMPLTAHGTMGERGPTRCWPGPPAAPSTCRRRSSPAPCPRPCCASCGWSLSGVLDRLPELRIYLAETNASWLPYVLYMVDDSYSIFRHWYGADLQMAPSDYAWRHFSFGIVRDPLALRMRELLASTGSCGGRTSRTRSRPTPSRAAGSTTSSPGARRRSAGRCSSTTRSGSSGWTPPRN